MSEETATIQRILMTTDTLGGIWTYALELAGALGQHDIQVVLATMGGPPSAFQRAESQRIPGLTLCESQLKLEWMEEPWEDISRAARWLLQLEEAIRPDIVHLNGYVHGALPWQAPIRGRAPVGWGEKCGHGR